MCAFRRKSAVVGGDVEVNTSELAFFWGACGDKIPDPPKWISLPRFTVRRLS